MIEPDQQYLFASARVPNSVAAVLANLQRDIAQTLKEKEHRHKLLPRRMFLVPLFNLRNVPRLSDESIVLAIERIRDSIGPVTLTVRQIESWPSAEKVEQIVARLDDENGELRSLRTRLVDALGALGFSVNEGEWNPIIPLIRVSKGEDAPAFELNTDVSSDMSWNVSEVELLGRQTTEQRARFQVRSRARLTSQSADTEAGSTPEEEQIRNEIASVLESRIAQRRLRLSESRRSERAKNLRVEEDTTEPQHPDNSDD